MSKIIHRKKPKTKYYQPVIIIGAGRSGTNMLRDILTQLPGFGTWPCDEINYIWRHGNVTEPTDEFSPQLATEQVKLFIRKEFDKIATKQGIDYVVEKTCANSLRVGFVHQVFPEAKFIHIIRDGRDVIVSAQKRWKAQLEFNYIFTKARFIPRTDIPYYAIRYFLNRIYRIASGKGRLAFWGPLLKGMDNLLQEFSLTEVCAVQWQRCVEKAEEQLKNVSIAQVYSLRYEDFVLKPDLELIKIAQFLGVELNEQQAYTLVDKVSTQSVGTWKKELDSASLMKAQSLIQDTLKQHGYL